VQRRQCGSWHGDLEAGTTTETSPDGNGKVTGTLASSLGPPATIIVLEPHYSVTCDIHTTMRASILVTASPYTATPGEDGSFSIGNVQPGPYALTIYTGPAPVVRPIDVKSGPTDLGVMR
jgi:hypothetical protein